MAYDFSAINNGDTIYYRRINSTVPFEVAVTYSGSNWSSISNEYSGTLSIPSSVVANGGVIYLVTSIDDYAFAGCSNLTSVIIGGNVSSVGSAFDNCNSITSIIVNDNSYYQSIEGILYNKLMDVLIKCPQGKIGELVIPNSVATIGSNAFYGCARLTSIIIENSVNSIGNNAFEFCSGLTSIIIPNSVNAIGNWAFADCINLTSITYPNSIPFIGDGMFQNCKSLTSFEIPNSVTSIGTMAFFNCSALTSITCKTKTPPTINSNPFYNVSTSIPIYVPCGSLSLYQTAQCWESFANIQGVATNKINASICAGGTYPLNGFNVSEAGTYTRHLQTLNGCDSTINLTLTLNQPDTTNIIAEICAGQVYNLNGFNVINAGNYSQTLQTIQGCDSIVNLMLTVNQPTTTNLTAEICQGEIYTLNGFNVSAAGLHTKNLQTINGCDSIVNLVLTVNPTLITNLAAEICQGEIYNLNGFNESTSGIYTQNLQTINGCDSIVNLTLTVNQPAITNITAEICQGETYTLNGFNTSTAGTYTKNLQTIHGCDSTVNLTLTINQPAITNLTAEICQGETYTLNGFNISTSGLHTLNLQTENGCDSTVNLILTINQPAITNLTAEICQGNVYSENGFNVSTSGSYTQHLQTTNGCDSIVNLTLTVNNVSTPTNLAVQLLNNYLEITWQGDGESYELYRNNDSITTVSQPIYLDRNVINGEAYCYKIKSIIGDCGSEFSNVVCKSFAGLESQEVNEAKINLYPNPTNDKSILKVEGLTKDADVIVYDINGRKIKQYKINSGQGELEIDVNSLAKGIYNIKVVNDNVSLVRKLIVK